MFELDWAENIAEDAGDARRLAQREELTRELKRSLALERIDPSSFESGSCSVSFSSRYPHKWPQNFTVKIRKSDGKVSEVELNKYRDEGWLNDLAFGQPFYKEPKS